MAGKTCIAGYTACARLDSGSANISQFDVLQGFLAKKQRYTVHLKPIILLLPKYVTGSVLALEAHFTVCSSV